MAEFTKQSIIEDLKASTQNASGMFEISEDTICALMSMLAATPAPVSVPDERAAFETFMEERFKDCIDRRMVKNGGGEYFAWDMQVAWITWQGRAAMLQAGNHTEQHLDMANSPVIHDGWQLVPKEPTEAMNKAGWAAINEHDEINPTYRAMLAAAPQHEVKK